MHTIRVFIISLLAILSFSSSCYANDDFPPGKYKIDITTGGGRPSSPYPPLENYNRELTQHGTGSAFTVPVTRHHIIPYQLLRDFYNMVTTNGDMARFRSFFLTMSTSITYYASSNSIDCSGGTLSDLSAASTLAQAFGSLYANGGGQINPPGLDTFQQFYTWLPGNLFVGPSNRSDDPHDGMAFEQNAATVVGSGRFTVLQRTYNNLIQYVQHGNRNVLGNIASDLSRIATIRSVYALDPSDWEFVSGQYRLRANAPRKTDSDEITTQINKSNSTCKNVQSNFKSMRAKYYSVLLSPFSGN
ncbi:hypothetical protein [Aeromonas jandaei]|uniref:hypothetical protein n=1 Tax=Aeromonas jandaei TaxID=650 RepID=UPI003D1D4744